MQAHRAHRSEEPSDDTAETLPGLGKPAPRRAANAPASIGDLVAGRFVLEGVIGDGAMGTVFAARSTERDETVAIKFLHPHLCVQPSLVDRFQREARATSRLRSDHITRVLDVGVHASGAPFIVMEYLDGQDLRSLVKHRGPLPLAEAADYVLQAASGLAEAHALGIVHRDLKPANLLRVTRADGGAQLKIVDFGIAKFTSPNIAGDSRHPTGELILGSYPFMAPEQVENPSRVDARSDVWALGAILYFLLTGAPPFQARTMAESIMKAAQDPPDPRLLSVRPDVSAEIETVVLRCLQKQREKRFANMVELARTLVAVLPSPSSFGPESGLTVTARLPLSRREG